MIKRIVKLTFRSEEVNRFLKVFEKNKSTIRASPGCSYLELLQDAQASPVFFTISIWESEAHLNAYRHSDFFKSTWSTTKRLFAERPEAWTLEIKHRLP